ncbi:uncharacterized protein [Dysidea avara]|uniref:uncharacterized protein isoform X2 n=1 Tax=Dysidea avara TaxID=196820 RepID=UPI00331E7142
MLLPQGQLQVLYCKSVKLLTSAPKPPSLADAGRFNNLGCLHNRMGKYSLASYYFSSMMPSMTSHHIIGERCLQQAGTLPLESILLRVTELLPQIDYTSTVW